MKRYIGNMLRIIGNTRFIRFQSDILFAAEIQMYVTYWYGKTKYRSQSCFTGSLTW